MSRLGEGRRPRGSRAESWSWPVALYVPNLIGYARIALCAVALSNVWEPRHFMGYYLASFLLDAVDGFFARVLGQDSSFGALLDMVTDRCATAALLATLAHLYSMHVVFLPLIYLDGISHWMQMLAAACEKASSHKDACKSRVLRWYYWRPVLTVVCLFNELFLIVLYALHFKTFWTKSTLLLLQCFAAASCPVFALKQSVNVNQVFAAHQTLTRGSSWR